MLATRSTAPRNPSIGFSIRLALWAQAHPWKAIGVLAAGVATSSSAVLLIWYGDWAGALDTAVMMTVVHVPEGVLLGAAACLLGVTLRRRRIDTAGAAWFAIGLLLPVVWFLPAALWAVYGPFGAAVSWTSPETITHLALTSLRALVFLATLLAVLRLVPRHRSRRSGTFMPIAVASIAVLGTLAAVAAHHALPDVSMTVTASAVGGTLVVALWLGLWVRVARPGVVALCLSACFGALVCWGLEIGYREFVLNPSTAERLHASPNWLAAYFEVWGRLFGVVPFAPLVRALDRVSLIPPEHPANDTRA